MHVVRFKKQDEGGCGNSTEINVIIDGEEIGNLYREEGMDEWNGDRQVRALCSASHDDDADLATPTLREAKSMVRRAVRDDPEFWKSLV